jgi:hypothetical protein
MLYLRLEALMVDNTQPRNGETRTRAIPGSTEVTAIFFDFKTGERTNAGTDARVVLRIGDRVFPMPARRAGHDLFERGGVDVIGFPTGRSSAPDEPRLDLDALRRAAIVLAHDRSGKCPAWYVERLSILIKLALPQEPVLEFRHWNDVGWVDAEKPRGATVVLQEGECSHPIPRERCASCRSRWPDHPGLACKCTDCAASWPKLLPA